MRGFTAWKRILKFLAILIQVYWKNPELHGNVCQEVLKIVEQNHVGMSVFQNTETGLIRQDDFWVDREGFRTGQLVQATRSLSWMMDQ